MITVDLFWAMASFLFLCICLVIGRWVFYNYSEETGEGETRNLQQCPYCTYIFFDYDASSFRICPRCESYISNMETGENKKTAVQENEK